MLNPHTVTIEEFWKKVDRRDGACWEWRGYRGPKGYGTCYFQSKMRRSHRVAFFLANGKWPTPACLHHCDNRSCCNPAHLYAGTDLDNARDRDTRKRRRAPSGEASANAKLTNTESDCIRVEYAAGGITLQELADRYSVSRSTIHAVVRGRRFTSHSRPPDPSAS
jgi:hypothetical protein